MKHTIIMIALSAITFTASAKTNPDNTKLSVLGMHKPFAHTDFDLQEDLISFTRLPKNAVVMYIFDSTGNIASSGTLNRKNHTVSVKQLQPGLYTIVLKQGAKVKMFGYHTDIVIKGVKK